MMRSYSRRLLYRQSIGIRTASPYICISSRRSLGFWSRFKDAWHEEVQKRKQLRDGLDDLSKRGEAVSESATKLGETASSMSEKVGETVSTIVEPVSKGVDKVGEAVDSIGELARNNPISSALDETAKVFESTNRGISSKVSSVASEAKKSIVARSRTAQFIAHEIEGIRQLVGGPIESSRPGLLSLEERIQLVERGEWRFQPESKVTEDDEAAAAAASAGASSTPDDDNAETTTNYDDDEKDMQTAIVVGETPNKTIWGERMERVKATFRASPIVSVRQTVKRALAKSENPVVQNIRETKKEYDDVIAELREDYETSQHPLIWKMRDIADSAFGETETGYALGRLMEIDQHWRMDSFLREMEHFMIPVVVEAWLNADMNILEIATDGKAWALMKASQKERQTQGQSWDPRILNIAHVDIQQALVIDHMPLLSLTFVCQHVNCVRDKKGDIVKGNESDIHSTFYHWVLERNLHSINFNYRIREMASQRMLSLG